MKAKYFGVIGNRDYIKLHGDKLPYWCFLDTKPDGWLSSLVYKRKDLPEGQMIFDCGAWSYKDKEVPDYTVESAIKAYEEFAPPHSILIAPDHMLIDGTNLDARRLVNRDNAAAFLDKCPRRFQPMACVHGMTLDERLEHAAELLSLGYKYIAVGGVAARAAQKQLVVSMTAELRKATDGAVLHVLGLSSPEYMRAWRKLGVDSCDGSSHFKQAFTGGAFFTQEGARLIKHQAARPGNADCAGIVAPECFCRACLLLRSDGIDTRTYGSNEHNMGRAAHNQNMLMRAQREAMRMHLVLVACCGQKLQMPTRAADLYQSSLFKKSRAWAEQNGDAWAILSAKHGIVLPDSVIEPYDQTLSGASTEDRMRWSNMVEDQLMGMDLRYDDNITVLAGSDYCGWTKLVPQRVKRPMEGLGIGQQLAWLTQHTTTTKQTELFA